MGIRHIKIVRVWIVIRLKNIVCVFRFLVVHMWFGEVGRIISDILVCIGGRAINVNRYGPLASQTVSTPVLLQGVKSWEVLLNLA